MTLAVYVRAPNLQRGPQVEEYDQLEAVPRFNDVGTWSLQMPFRGDAAQAFLEPGAGILIEDDGWSMSGPLAQPTRVVSGPGPGTLTVAGVDDLVVLADRLVYPTPTAAVTLQTAAAYYNPAAAPGETTLKALANLNAGPGALAARRAIGAVEADQARGSSVRPNERFTNLLEALRALALAGGDLGFDVVTVAGVRTFRVYDPVARPDVVLSRDAGNLRRFSYTRSAPTATRVAVAGQGEGTARTIRERAAPAAETAWARRVETFLDRRDTNDPVVLDQAGDEELARGAAVYGLSLEPEDTTQVRFGVDYGLGDRITVVVDGVQLVDVVREVTIRRSSTGAVTTSPTVGTPGADRPLGDQFDVFRRLLARLRATGARVDALERRR